VRLRDKRVAAAHAYSAEQAKALVDAYATEHEKASLDFSAMAGAGVRLGWRLTDLAAADSGEELERPLPPFEWDPSALAEVVARIRARRELRLPARECFARKPPPEASSCLCLAKAIDAAIASGHPMTRDEVLKAARQAHAQRWAWLKRKPKPRPEPLPSRSIVPDRNVPQPRPTPRPERATETSTKPARIIR
jgi:hypothetical protein